MNCDNIILIGIMGSGKTTIGRILADKLQWPFVDTDQLIEKREGRTISDIFAAQGEPFFRLLESKILAEVLGQKKQVVATGGGSVLASENRNIMLKNGLVVALTAPAEVIIQRVRQSQHRPLLKGNVEERVLQLMESRKHAYDFAQARMDTSVSSLEQVAESIIRLCEK